MPPAYVKPYVKRHKNDAAGAILFPAAASLAFYLVYIAVLVVLLLGVCWLKGEPPRWRWGNDEQV